jgi:hypothetical protein
MTFNSLGSLIALGRRQTGSRIVLPSRPFFETRTQQGFHFLQLIDVFLIYSYPRWQRFESCQNHPLLYGMMTPNNNAVGIRMDFIRIVYLWPSGFK